MTRGWHMMRGSDWLRLPWRLLRWLVYPVWRAAQVFAFGMLAERPLRERIAYAIEMAALLSRSHYRPLWGYCEAGGTMLCGVIFVSPREPPWPRTRPRHEWALALCRQYGCLYCWQVGGWYVMV